MAMIDEFKVNGGIRSGGPLDSSNLGSINSDQESLNVEQPTQGTFETISDFFEKPVSLVKNAIGDLVGAESTRDVTVSSILKGTKFVNTDQFKNELLGKINTDTTTGKVLNFAANFAVDTALDPLTYIPAIGILKNIVKSKNGAVVAESLGRSLLMRGAVGSIIGITGTRFDENSLSNSLRNIGKGFAAGALSKFVSRDGVKILGKTGDGVYNALVAGTLGAGYFASDKFADGLKLTPSLAHSVEREFTKRTKDVKDTYLHLRTSMFNDIKGEGGEKLLKSFDSVINDGASKTISMRNMSIDSELKRINKLLPKNSKEIKRLDASELDSITAAVNTQVGQEIDMVLKAKGDPKLTKFVNNYIKDNRLLIKNFNKSNAEHFKNLGREFPRDVVPLDFHSVDVSLPTDAIKGMYNLKGEGKTVAGFLKRTKEDFSTAGLSFEERSKIGAERFTEALATKTEKKAIEINRVIQLNAFKRFGETGAGIEKAINAWDNYRRLWKSSVLGASSAWIKNNMFENAVRGMMKLGPVEGTKVAFDQLPTSELFRKLFKISDPVNGFKHLDVNDDLLFLANKTGVLETNFFDDMLKRTGNSTRVAKLRNILSSATDQADIEKLNQLIKQETPGIVGKTTDAYVGFLNNTVFRFGRTVENGARVSFFDSVLSKQLKGSPSINSMVKKEGLLSAYEKSDGFKKMVSEAKQLTNDTFFDYGNLSAFEEKILKRVVPFYSFYSKNLAFHMREMESNTKGVAALMRGIRSTGRKPTEEERKGVPEWMQDSFFRVSNDGKDLVQIPNVSIADALDNFSIRNFGGKLDPVLKTVVEQLRNREFGLDQPVRPSESKFGTKRLFSRALKFEALLPETGRDKHGNLATSSDLSGSIDNIVGNLLPIPIIDQVLGTRNDIVNKGKDSAVTIGNKLLPIRTRDRIEVFNRTIKRRKGLQKLRERSRERSGII